MPDDREAGEHQGPEATAAGGGAGSRADARRLLTIRNYSEGSVTVRGQPRTPRPAPCSLASPACPGSRAAARPLGARARARPRGRAAGRRGGRVPAGDLLRRLLGLPRPRLTTATRSASLPTGRAATRSLIDLLSVAGRSLAAITTAQHLAGLAVGVLVYALVLRLGLPRCVAAARRRARAARRLRDRARAADPGGGVLHARARREPSTWPSAATAARRAGGERRAAGARRDDAHGRAVRGARLDRVRAVGPRPLRARWPRPRSALLVPLLAYSACTPPTPAASASRQADGWFLYGRVGQIADCGGADIPRRRAAAVRPQRARPPRGRRLPHLERRRPGAPRVRRDEPRPRRAGALERALRDFALAIIRDRPRRVRARSSATTSCATSTRAQTSRGNSDLAVHAARDRPARAAQRAGPRPLVPGLRPAGASARRGSCATTRSGSTPRAG